MIFEIKQTTANGHNQFEIYEQNMLIYRAETNFLKPTTPAVGDALRRLSLKSDSGTELLYTHYDVSKNLAASAVPFSYLFGNPKRVRRYSVTDAQDNTIGSFYYEQSGVADTKLVIACGETAIACFKRSVGNKEVVSFYDGEVQVGQLTKPNCVINNLDFYFLHFSDNYRYMQSVLALFVVYYDFLFHHHSGEIVKGYRYSKTYTYDKNNKKYNQHYIAENFGETESQRVEAMIQETYDTRQEKSGFNVKKFWLIFGLGWAAVLAVTAVAALIILNHIN